MNRHRKLIKSGIFLTLAAVFLLTFPELSFTQQKTAAAYLDSGPSPITGIPGIGVNVLKGWKGVYLLQGEKKKSGSDSGKPGESVEEEKVTVYFTQNAVPVFESWSELKIESNIIYKTGQKNLYIYRYPENWTLLIEFQNDNIESADFSFMDNLIRQMIFFVRDGSNFVNSSFPAVIEYVP
ncbi:MAG: hypothetical protein RBT69_10815 [Spirochaetia bacterium]|nr:hypothetical protein [Spirochaetia bacterium]